MISRKLRLALDFLRALPGEIAYSRRTVAYRGYLTTRYPTTIFGAGCAVSDDCDFSEGVWVG